MELHTRHRWGFVAGAAALVLALAVAAALAQDRKPNIVVILWNLGTRRPRNLLVVFPFTLRLLSQRSNDFNVD